MASQEMTETLCERIDKGLREKGVQPSDVKIDFVLPHDVLETVASQTLLEIATEIGFLVPECGCGKVRPNGKWFRPQTGYINKNPDPAYCPECQNILRMNYDHLRQRARSFQEEYGVMPPSCFLQLTR